LALIEAQRLCQGVVKDKKNSHFAYRYASCEAILVEVREALTTAGLAIVARDNHLETVNGQMLLKRTFLIVHSLSGESLEMNITWPVCPDRGKAADKAVASALTSSLAYALRDMLLLPRVDSHDEMDSRTSEPEAASPETPIPTTVTAPTSLPVASPTTAQSTNGVNRATPEQIEKIAEYRRELSIPDADWRGILSRRNVTAVEQLTSEQAESLRIGLSERISNLQLHG
jgi:hypothetical protein